MKSLLLLGMSTLALTLLLPVASSNAEETAATPVAAKAEMAKDGAHKGKKHHHHEKKKHERMEKKLDKEGEKAPEAAAPTKTK